MPSPENVAREKIDKLLAECGWTIYNCSTINLFAARGVALCETLPKERDDVDYLLFVDAKAIGTVEAKPEGLTLTSVEEHAMLCGLFVLFLNKQKPQGEITRGDRRRFRRVRRSVCIAASSQRRRRLARRVVLCKQTA